VLFALGCGGMQESYAPVEGKVTLGGKPLAGVMVRFYPVVDGNINAPYATGTTDAGGVYRLTSRDGKDGAMVGKHRVVINWPPRERPVDPAKRPPPAPDIVIPLVYTVASDTPLLVEVKGDHPQTIDLPLQK
jgi:hypothetical protein